MYMPKYGQQMHAYSKCCENKIDDVFVSAGFQSSLL